MAFYAGAVLIPILPATEVVKIANCRFDDLVAHASPIASARVARIEQLNR